MTTSTGRRVLARLGLAAAALLPIAAGAQAPATQPSAAECAAAATLVRTSAKGTPGAASWWTSTRCGAQGASALVSIVSTLARESDAQRIQTIEGVLRTVRDGYLFQAERELAGSSWASGPARALALRLLLAQHNPGMLIVSLAPDLAATPACRTQMAALPAPTEGAPLPADYASQANQTARAVAGDAGASAEARATARCLGEVLGAFVPAAVTPASLELVYVCGNTFRVHNPNADWADVTYAVEGTSDSGDLSVPPNGHATFVTDASGSTQLYYNEGHEVPLGTLVRTVANGGTACAQGAPRR